MKKLLTVAIALATAGLLFAQESLSSPDPTVIGNDSARQALREVSVVWPSSHKALQAQR